VQDAAHELPRTTSLLKSPCKPGQESRRSPIRPKSGPKYHGNRGFEPLNGVSKGHEEVFQQPNTCLTLQALPCPHVCVNNYVREATWWG
jgi:hypothetical protein